MDSSNAAVPPRTGLLVKTPRVSAWMAGTGPVRLLHLFENSLSLVREGALISVVNPEIGPGPFNLVLDRRIDFTRSLREDDPIRVSGGRLELGSWQIDVNAAADWQPRPDWPRLDASASTWLFGILDQETSASQVQSGLTGLDPPGLHDGAKSAVFARRLAGLGPGLTPSGDDYLMGWMHAAWMLLDAEEARRVSRPVAAAAAPLTTALSAAWLEAAAQGEAGAAWHDLCTAISIRLEAPARAALRRILGTGHSSGADALAGFAAGLKKIGREQLPPDLGDQC